MMILEYRVLFAASRGAFYLTSDIEGTQSVFFTDRTPWRSIQEYVASNCVLSYRAARREHQKGAYIESNRHLAFFSIVSWH